MIVGVSTITLTSKRQETIGTARGQLPKLGGVLVISFENPADAGHTAMRIIDLSRELYHRTPSYPGQPPVIHGVWKTHAEAFADSGNVHGNSVMYFSMPDHGGTHIDAPRHFGKSGMS